MKNIKKKLNGWQRLGIVISAFWILGVLGIASKEYSDWIATTTFKIRAADATASGSKEYFDWITATRCDTDHPPNSLFTAWGNPQPCPEKVDPLQLLTQWNVQFRINRFLLVLILPVIVGWIGSYCLLRVVRWVKEGFKETTKTGSET